jgi:hypothetical protein
MNASSAEPVNVALDNDFKSDTMSDMDKLLGRTYILIGTGIEVRVVAVNKNFVSLVSTEENTRTINGTLPRADFDRLNLEES